jgi:hypothetical protein
MAKKNRDEFTEKTKLQIAKRTSWLCSNPECRRETVGSNSDGTGEILLGIAAHICAAAPGGPRYDPNQTPAQRRSPDNGIWMCTLDAAVVDAKDPKYTVELLHEWKAQAQKDSWLRVLHNDVPRRPATKAPTEGELSTKIHAAAAADLDVFRRSDKWPSTTIALTLKVDGLSDPVSTAALATALTTLDDLILVAPPGMGKTTTLFQIAEAVLAKGNASPIIVPLGDWSTDGAALLESVLKRPAFRGIYEADLRAVAAKPGVILLLDGWNELDSAARKRLAVQVVRLQAELPELTLLISTRKQVLDVPVNGTRINLLPLSEKQQLEIAKALRGDAGVRMVDQAWRTTGVRELVTIPLYLTALLALPEGAPFPTTKEEVLRRFVAVHEEDTQRAEALAEVTHGLHQRFLEDLAVTATRAANTTHCGDRRPQIRFGNGERARGGRTDHRKASAQHGAGGACQPPRAYAHRRSCGLFVSAPAISGMVRVALRQAPDVGEHWRCRIPREAEGGSSQSAGMGRVHSLRVRAAGERRPKTAGSLRCGHSGRVQGRSHSRRRDDFPFDRCPSGPASARPFKGLLGGGTRLEKLIVPCAS